MKEILWGLYAVRVVLPFSGWSRQWRRFSRRLRGRERSFLQATRLPQMSWSACSPLGQPRVWEPGKANGNVRLGELGVLAALAAGCPDDTNLFEIGTFDGRTALNLAFNAPAGCRIHTLDLPPDQETRFALARGERHLVDKPQSGARLATYRSTHPDAVGRIHQLLGDSATFDFGPYAGTCSLVFVDGSHAYDYAMSDTRVAMRLVRPGGVIVWHDYGIWEGVTRALEELETAGGYGFRNIRGSSLVYWRSS